MAEVQLNVETRSERGKGPARRLRAAGKVPATLYGGGGDPISLAVDARELSAALGTQAGVNALLSLRVNGEQHLTMARELFRDPIRGAILHVDFLRIDTSKTITVDVPVHIEGEAVGIKEGGVLEHHLWQVHLSCLPTNVPERINVDISALKIGDVVRLADLTPPEGVTFLTAEEEIIASVVVPQVLQVEEEVEVPELAEGEVPPEGEEGEAAAAGEAAGEEPAAGGDEG